MITPADATSDCESLTFLFDVDNTLLNNDALKNDLAEAVLQQLGPERSHRFWQIYEDVRAEEQYVDYPETIRRTAKEYGDDNLARSLRNLIDSIHFRDYLYPNAIEVIQYVRRFGATVIFSDGDPVFQPFKIRESGIERAVDGKVLIAVHKEQELSTLFRQYPSKRYVVIDDKSRIIAALEDVCPTEFTTIQVLQGKYAVPDEFDHAADWTVANIGDLLGFTREQFLGKPEARE